MNYLFSRARNAFEVTILLALLLFALPIHSQQSSSDTSAKAAAKPDQTQSAAAQQDTKDKKDENQQAPPPKKNDRIFGVLPNYTTVEGAKDIKPISSKEKFKLAIEAPIDPYSFMIAGVVAAKAQALNDPESWGQGWAAFGKRYGAAVADQTLGPLMTTGVFPSLLHQDPRYFQLGTGTFKHRFGYAFSRLFVTRTDSGHSQFNYSEFVGNAAAAALSNLYYPPENHNVSSNLNTYATQIAIDLLGNELKEFWPDMKRKLFKKKKPHDPDPAIP